MLDALEECGAATEAGIQQRAHATRHSLLERHRYNCSSYCPNTLRVYRGCRLMT